MKWIDIHSHILPGIDDGATNLEETMRMLKKAANGGIEHIIATPHFHYRRGHAKPEQIRMLVENARRLIAEEGISIQLDAGNELYCTHELLQMVKDGEALTLADSNYVLLEFSPDTERKKIQNAVYQFLCEDYYPIIAHVERYEAFQHDWEFTEDVSDMGAYFQVNSGSLSGTFGWRIKKFSRMMVQRGMVQFVATDAHDLQKRSPVFMKAETWMLKKLGAVETEKILYRNPKMILKNKAL